MNSLNNSTQYSIEPLKLYSFDKSGLPIYVKIHRYIAQQCEDDDEDWTPLESRLIWYVPIAFNEEEREINSYDVSVGDMIYQLWPQVFKDPIIESTAGGMRTPLMISELFSPEVIMIINGVFLGIGELPKLLHAWQPLEGFRADPEQHGITEYTLNSTTYRLCYDPEERVLHIHWKHYHFCVGEYYSLPNPVEESRNFWPILTSGFTLPYGHPHRPAHMLPDMASLPVIRSLIAFYCNYHHTIRLGLDDSDTDTDSDDSAFEDAEYTLPVVRKRQLTSIFKKKDYCRSDFCPGWEEVRKLALTFSVEPTEDDFPYYCPDEDCSLRVDWRRAQAVWRKFENFKNTCTVPHDASRYDVSSGVEEKWDREHYHKVDYALETMARRAERLDNYYRKHGRKFIRNDESRMNLKALKKLNIKKSRDDKYDVSFGLPNNINIGLNQNTIDSLVAALGNIKINHNVSDVNVTASNQIIDVINSCIGFAKEAMLFLALASIICAAIKFGWTKTAIMFIIGAVLLYLGIRPDCKAWITSMFEKIFSKGQRYKLSAGIEESIASALKCVPSSLLSTLLVGCATIGFISKIPISKTVDTILQRCDRLPKAIKGITELIALIKTSWNASVIYIKEHVYHETTGVRLDGGLHEVQEWIKSMEYFIDPAVMKNISTDTQAFNKAVEIHRTGLRLMRQQHEMPRVVLEQFKSGIHAAKTIYNKALQTAMTSSIRVKPVCALLLGNTSVGKSGAVYPLALSICESLGLIDKETMRTDPASWEKHVYSRASEQEFWDGYNAQSVVVVDEAFQRKDNAMNPNIEVFELFRMCNIFRYYLHMAALEEKNSTPFNGKAIILTSNDYRMQFPSIISPEAVISRITHPYIVRVKPEYRKDGDDQGRMDPVKVEKDFKQGKAGLHLNIYQFVPVKLIANKEPVEVGPPISFWEMRDQITSAIKRTLTKCDELQDFMTDYISMTEEEYNQTYMSEHWKDLQEYKEFVPQKPETVPEIDISRSTKLARLREIEEELEGLQKKRTQFFKEERNLQADIRSENVDLGNPTEYEISGAWYNIKQMAQRAFYGDLPEKDNPNTGYVVTNNGDIVGIEINNEQIAITSATRKMVNAYYVKDSTGNSPFGDVWEISEVQDENGTWPKFKSVLAEGSEATMSWAKRLMSNAANSLREVYQAAEDVWAKHPIIISLLTISVIVSLFFLYISAKWCRTKYLEKVTGSINVGITRKGVEQMYNYMGIEAFTDFIERYPEWKAVLYSKIRIVIVEFEDEEEGPDLRGMWIPKSVNLQSYEVSSGSSASKDQKPRVKYHVSMGGSSASRQQKPASRFHTAAENKPHIETSKGGHISFSANGKNKELDIVGAVSGDAISRILAPMPKELLNHMVAYMKDREVDSGHLIGVRLRQDEETGEVFLSGTDASGEEHMWKVDIEMECASGQYQICYDQSADDAQQKSNPNHWIITLHLEDGAFVRLGFVVVVEGTIGLMPYHFVKAYEAYKNQVERVVLYNATNPGGIEIPQEQFKTVQRIHTPSLDAHKQKDACLISLGRSMPQHRKLTSQWMTLKEYAKINAYNGSFLKYHRNVQGTYSKDDRYVVTGKMRMISSFYEKVEAEYNGQYLEFYYAEAIAVGVKTQKGDCGALLTVHNEKLSGKYAGILCLSDKKEAETMFVPVTKEELTSALAKFGKVDRISVPSDFVLSGVQVRECRVPEGNFTPLGECKALPRASKTTLAPTPIVHNKVMETFRKPAQLRPTSTHDPLWVGLKKCGEPVKAIDPKFVEMASRDVQRLLFNTRKDTSDLELYRRVLTFEESVKGIDGHPYINAITRTTSPGYPWVLRRPAQSPGKRMWFGDDEDFKLESPAALEVKRVVEEMQECASKGERFDVIWVDTLKDELRPIEKVNQGKTRVFSAGPMHYTILARMYFLPFIAFLQENRLDNQLAVGVKPFDNDWHRLSQLLRSKGARVVAGDFTNYDGTESAQILWAICDIVNNWFDDGPENRLIREVLFSEIAHGVHLCEGNVYLWNRSLPSGNPFTATFNSIYNIIAMRIVWMIQTKRSMLDFNRNVWMIAYGDDNVVNLSTWAAEHFNQEIMTAGFTQIGMTYTDELKSGVGAVRRLDEISFLKRSFRYDEDRATTCAPLQLAQVLDQTNWIRTNINSEEASALNFEVCLRELSLHGRETFNEWAPKIIEAYPSEVLARAVYSDCYDTYVFEDLSDVPHEGAYF